jgi:hypothetical protein
MRFTKVLGLAAVAAMAAMAFIGTGSASALPDEVVLCSTLITNQATELCPNANVLPQGTEILGLASKPTLKSSFTTVECEDSTSTAKITSPGGMSEHLAYEITALEFGVLPTPKLGAGCTGCKQIHTTPPYSGTILMNTSTDYDATVKGSATLKECGPFSNVECKYENSGLELLIDPDATKHPLGTVKGDLLLIEDTLKKIGGGFLCSSTGVWTASYTTIGCHVPAVGAKNCWLALREHL